MAPLFLLVLFGVMWFFMIRPQQQRLKKQRLLVMTIQPGDEVVTAGGIIGTLTDVSDREVTLDTGSGQRLRIVRSAISAKLGPELPPAPEAEV